MSFFLKRSESIAIFALLDYENLQNWFLFKVHKLDSKMQTKIVKTANYFQRIFFQFYIFF